MTARDPAAGSRQAPGWSLTVSEVGPQPELVADRLWQLGATAVAEQDRALVAGFADEKSARAAAGALTGAGVRATVAADEGAWRSTWRAFAADIEVVPLTIRIVERAGDSLVETGIGTPAHGGRARLVEIDPGDSFGSGQHPSTLRCLREVVGRAGPGLSVLDVGTGSGILAVAASVLGAAPVVAVDVDPDAVAVAGANARANGVPVEIVCGTVTAIRGGFDLVVANLGGAEAPIALAPDLGARLGPGGTLVLAGLLEEQAEAVSLAYAPTGTATVTVEDGWACLSITR